LKQRWERLTDGDLERVDGQAGHLLALLEEKYGYGRHRAERELVAFLDAFLQQDWQRGPARARVALLPPGSPLRDT
jgi:uncharacterized protein YjbJ (UPF0337 family)